MSAVALPAARVLSYVPERQISDHVAEVSQMKVLCWMAMLAALLAYPAGWADNGAPWKLSAEPILVMEGMQVPESVYFDARTGLTYISNIVGEGWTADSEGFITLSKPGEDFELLKWREATSQSPLSAPKGMCLLDGWLYVADIDRVHKFRTNRPESDTIMVPGAQRLNDLATDGEAIFASDTGRGCVFRMDPSGESITELPGVPVINGITFGGGKMYAVSWAEHDVYELDPTGEAAPRPFGLADHFTNLDGIEVMDDGCFLVSDFIGNKVCLISADEKTVTTLVELSSPADIGYDREGQRLFIPQFREDRVVVYQIEPAGE